MNDVDPFAWLAQTLQRRLNGWALLMRMLSPALEAMVKDGDLDPLLVAAEQSANVRKYAPLFLRISFPARRRDAPESD
ncbi:hypothetical protein [Mesorhizobium sp. ORM16]|uniref:hypothetical protein n=1 Tax=Mesorhizobium sp. ORM16 TaxID=3376989 RepID=UPI0038579698